MNHVISLKVQDFTIYSDHRPLELIISIPNKFRYDMNAYKYTNMPQKHKWKIDSSVNITQIQKTPKFNNRIDEILHKCYDKNSDGSKSFNKDVSCFIMDLADEALTKSKGLPNRFKKRWFDVECLVSKRNLARLAKKLPKHRYVEDLSNNYYDQKRKHSKLIKRKKSKHILNLNEKIENGKILNWSAFKKVKTENNQQSISLDTFDLYNLYLFLRISMVLLCAHSPHCNFGPIDLGNYGNVIPPGEHSIDLSLIHI